MVRKYIEETAKITGMPIEEVEKSEPVKNFIKQIIGD